MNHFVIVFNMLLGECIKAHLASCSQEPPINCIQNNFGEHLGFKFDEIRGVAPNI